MNALCERFIGSLRRECLDHVLLLGEYHYGRVLGEYVGYFAEGRGWRDDRGNTAAQHRHTENQEPSTDNRPGEDHVALAAAG